MLMSGPQSILQDGGTLQTVYLPCAKDVLKFIAQFRQQQLKAIERTARIRRCCVVIEETRAEDKIFLTGIGEGLADAVEMVQVLIDRVVCDSYDFKQPGIATYIANGRLDSLTRIVNNEEKCYVRLEKKYLHNRSSSSSTSGLEATPTVPNASIGTAGVSASGGDPSVKSADSFVIITQQGHKVLWKVGDIATEQAHTLVSSQGVCSKAIFAAAGPDIVKIFHTPQPGEIVVTPGYQLACSHVLHTCCSKWDGGNGEVTLRSIVRASILKVDELGGDSIAFPIIGTGNLCFPPGEAGRIMLDEAVTVCQNNPLISVKDVRFVLYHGDQGLIDAFTQEGTSLQNKYRKTVEVVTGDLTQETTDAIVNIIHTDMNMNSAGDLSKAIARASGAQVEDECRSLGQQPVGTAVITSGGNLATSNIVHMVVNSSDKNHLQQCLERCLQLADTTGLKTISLPAVGTGAGGIPGVDSAQLTFRALKNSLENCMNLRHVRIILFQASLTQAFLDEKKLMEQQDNTQPVPSSTGEPPRKKIKTEQDAQSHQSNKNRLVIHVAGPSKAGVKRAMDTLKRGIAEAFTTQVVHHKNVSDLSKNQLSDLSKDAKTRDVKLILKVTGQDKSFVVQGEHSKVAEIVGKIWHQLNEQTERKREAENANFPVMSLPKNWEPMPRNQAGFDVTVHAVNLAPTSVEYQAVATTFYQTVGNYTISGIERIQNPHLYQSYQLRKQKMDKDNGGNNERLLFHGTSPDNVSKINSQGFNRSFSGTASGTDFGRGVYFARDASFSVGYANRSQAGVGNRCMYVAKVLVGQYCKGTNRQAVIPPPKDPSKPEELFDSVVNDAGNPSIFVVFFDNQCYPEYLIKF